MDSQRGANRTRHEIGIGQGGQLDEPYTVLVGCTGTVCYGDGHRRLADPAWPDDCQEAAPS